MIITKQYCVILGLAVISSSYLTGQIISPTAVPGKEYSNNLDVDALKAADPLQNLAWDGFGNNADAYDYSTSGSPPADPDQVDALANHGDYLFNELVRNQAIMVLSLEGENFVRYHDTGGLPGIWATPAQVRGPINADDVDGLEIWGPIDADHYSIIGDPITPPDISVYFYDAVNDNSWSYIAHSLLLTEVNSFLGARFEEIDVDALMVNDFTSVGEWEPSDEILFSLRPAKDVTGIFLDGGEIFHWVNGVGLSYLNQGGVVWDTVNDVRSKFGSLSENINALEAIPVPEPGSLLSAALLLAAFGCFWRRR